MKPLSLLFALGLVLAVALCPTAFSAQRDASPDPINGVCVGMSQEKFFKIYPKKSARTYRRGGVQEWLTFNVPPDGRPGGAVTFLIEHRKVKSWRRNDREEIIEEYLDEFCSKAINPSAMPLMAEAVRNVLKKIPYDIFLEVTDRRRPVLFTEYYDSGTARFANTSEIISFPDDAPAFEDGMTIVKLSTAMNDAKTPAAIEGVIVHELAHRVLEHSRKGPVTCQAEREANALIKRWGFEKEFEEASRIFGQKQAGGPVSCREEVVP